MEITEREMVKVAVDLLGERQQVLASMNGNNSSYVSGKAEGLLFAVTMILEVIAEG